MEAKPRPLLGSLLGLLLGIVVVALLWQLGVVPPDRLVLFGVLSITIAFVTILLTQRTVLVRKRFILVMVLCGLMAGVAVAGIPDAIAAGSITDGCSANATSSLDSKTPAQTSIADPFDVTGTDTVQWNAKSAGVLTNWRGSLGVDIGGFQVMIWSARSATEDLPKSLSGSADVASYLGDIGGGTGITLAGIYHVYGHLDADQRVCDMSAYVRVQSEGPFTGTLNMALWIALGALGLIVVIMAGVVRHSITRSARSAGGTAAPEATPEPRSINKRAEEPAQRADGGHQKRSDTQSRSRKERDKAARPSAEQARQEGRVRDDSRATNVALGEEVGARGENQPLGQGQPRGDDPAAGYDAMARGEGQPLGDDQPQGYDAMAQCHDDDIEATPSTEGDDKPAGQAD
jgi:hypothetical protein